MTQGEEASQSSPPVRGAIVSVRLDGEPEKRPHQWAPPSWPAPIRWLARLSHLLAILEGAGIAFCLLSVIFLAVWQFIDRNLVMHHALSPEGALGRFLATPPWTDGVIRHSVFMLGFLGGAYATYTGRHIRIDAVTRMVQAKRRMALRLVTTVGALALVLLFIYASWGLYQVNLEEVNEASQADQLFNSARGAMVMVGGYVLIAFHFFVQILLDLFWLLSKDTPPPEWIAEAAGGGH